MSLSERLAESVRACFTAVWIESHEQDDALLEITRLCQSEEWQLAVWDIASGLSRPGAPPLEGETGCNDPLAPLRALPALTEAHGTALLVLRNFHRFLGSPEIVETLARQIAAGKQTRTFVVILAPVVQIPIELEKLFLVLEHELPGREPLAEIARGIATEPGELPEGPAFEALLDSTAGLTRYEAEGAYSLSLVRHGRLMPEVIWELKSQLLKKSGRLSLHRGGECFADLGGLEALKAFCRRALRPRSAVHPLARPRGILLLSPPGCGKSAFAKSLGNEIGRPTLTLDIGTLMGSLVGATEQNIRQALRLAEAMAPAILFCDELEKGLAGASSSGQTDSGVTARLFGHLLTWLNDHDSDVFFVGTCNDISRLPPEFSRAERFDGVFFVDLPGARERQLIWNLYLEKFGLDPKQPRPVDTDWTGAEIRACCRLAALLEVSLLEAGKQVVPVAATAGESIARLRSWAAGRCLDADRTGLYAGPGGGSPKARRNIRRDPSTN